jgi:serine protease Do
MKKIVFILLLVLWVVIGVQANDKIENIENEIRFILNKVSPSLVKVIAENGQKYVATGIALGNGMIITTSLITRHPFETLAVETIKGETIAAKIAGQDRRSGLTLLRLDKKGPPPLPQAPPPEIGSWVALVGLFYDRFPSIFQGLVSSRSENELILNAPVAPGAAGGAVVNKKGELLGIIRGSVGFSHTPDFTFRDHAAAIVVSGEKNESGSLCYAIPVEQVRRIVEKLKTAGKTAPGWLGVNFSSDSNRVHEVLKKSPAAKAGMLPGDQIEVIAGKPITSFRDIAAALEFRLAGEKMSVTINRAGKPLRLEVELGERRDDEPWPPAFPEAPEFPEIPEDDLPQLFGQLNEMPELPDLESDLPRVRNYVIDFSGSRQLGMEVMELTADLGEKFSVHEGYGLLISRVNEGSAANKAGLKVGDIIVRANKNPVRSAFDLKRTMDALKEKEAVWLELYRDGQARKFSMVPEKNEKRTLDIRRFAQKMENLKENIGAETQMIYKNGIMKMRQAKEKALSELQKQKQMTWQQIKEESRKLSLELKKLQAEKEKLGVEARKKYYEQLKQIQEEIKIIREKIKSEVKDKKG